MGPQCNIHNVTIQRRATRWTLRNYDYHNSMTALLQDLVSTLYTILSKTVLHNLIALEIPPYFIPNNYQYKLHHQLFYLHSSGHMPELIHTCKVAKQFSVIMSSPFPLPTYILQKTHCILFWDTEVWFLNALILSGICHIHKN